MQSARERSQGLRKAADRCWGCIERRWGSGGQPRCRRLRVMVRPIPPSSCFNPIAEPRATVRKPLPDGAGRQNGWQASRSRSHRRRGTTQQHPARCLHSRPSGSPAAPASFHRSPPAGAHSKGQPHRLWRRQWQRSSAPAGLGAAAAPAAGAHRSTASSQRHGTARAAACCGAAAWRRQCYTASPPCAARR